MDGSTYKLGEILRELRGTKSLRAISELTGISHTHWSHLEKGTDPRTKKDVSPSPDTLKLISEKLSYPYNTLMKAAGYLSDEAKGIGQNKNKESETIYALPDPESWVNQLVREFENKNGFPMSEGTKAAILALVEVERSKQK